VDLPSCSEGGLGRIIRARLVFPLVQVACLGALLLTPMSAQGQSREQGISGRIVEEGSARPLAGALVQILTTDTVLLASETTDPDGHFQFSTPATDPFLVRVTRLDVPTTLLGPFDPALETSLGDLPVPITPLLLEGFEVSGESVCGANAESRRMGHDLLNEVRPIFQAIARGDALEDYQYVIEMVRPRKEWRNVNWWWTEDTTVHRTTRTIATDPPDSLVARGFAVQLNDSVTQYLPPDAQFLLSEIFPSAYCLSNITSESDSLDITFYPKEARPGVDISGVIRLARTGDGLVPTEVKFEYLNLEPFIEKAHIPWWLSWWEAREPYLQIIPYPPVVKPGRHGGYLRFGQPASGVWLTTSWQIDGVWLDTSGHQRGPDLHLIPGTLPLRTQARLIALVPVGHS